MALNSIVFYLDNVCVNYFKAHCKHGNYSVIAGAPAVATVTAASCQGPQIRQSSRGQLMMSLTFGRVVCLNTSYEGHEKTLPGHFSFLFVWKLNFHPVTVH